MILYAALDAFYLEHRRCAELDSGVDDHGVHGYVVWMTCACGARIAHRLPTTAPSSADQAGQVP